QPSLPVQRQSVCNREPKLRPPLQARIGPALSRRAGLSAFGRTRSTSLYRDSPLPCALLWPVPEPPQRKPQLPVDSETRSCASARAPTERRCPRQSNLTVLDLALVSSECQLLPPLRQPDQ